MNPDEWGSQNIIYGPDTGVPGPRNTNLTPYIIPWQRATSSGLYATTALTCGAQMGKTAGQLDIIGERLDTQPAPILYVGPSKEFNTDQFEPRIEEMLRQAKSLGAKVTKGKRQKKTLKWIAGVRLRLAHAGSSTALKSDSVSLAVVDEVEEMGKNVRNQGKVMGLVGARGFTFADFTTCVASTPGRGLVDSEIDMATGLEFWREAPPEDLESQMWKIWQSGTMHHWAVPCPHCSDYFVPMGKHLRYPENASAARVSRETHMECPNCHKPIYDEGEYPDGPKFQMNAGGLAIARGQWIENGEVVGEPEKDTTIYSLWVSGLMSPFVRWGSRAEEIVKASDGGDPGDMQTAVNAGYGELYAAGGGEVPEWKEVLQRRRPYVEWSVPKEALVLTAGIDVQGNRLVYVIRAWGARATSWLVSAGEIMGKTSEFQVWEDLADLLTERIDGRLIKVAFIDSGFRPGKPEIVPENMVYEFCRTHRRFCFPTKGHDTQPIPIKTTKIEVDARKGGAAKFSLELKHLDSDYFKTWVHDRIRWPDGKPGAWYLHETASEAYARQIVSEARTKLPNGKAQWVRRTKDNHYLDAEAMATAAGYMLNVHYRKDRMPAEQNEEAEEAVVVVKDDGEVIQRAAAALEKPKAAAQDATANKFAKMAMRLNQMKR